MKLYGCRVRRFCNIFSLSNRSSNDEYITHRIHDNLLDAQDTVSTVRKLVSEAFKTPVDHEVCIEGGHGHFLTEKDNDLPFIPLLMTSSKSPENDLTGLISLSCTVHIKVVENSLKTDLPPILIRTTMLIL